MYLAGMGLSSRHWFDNFYSLRNIYNSYYLFAISAAILVVTPLVISQIFKIHNFCAALLLMIIATVVSGHFLALLSSLLILGSSYLIGFKVIRIFRISSINWDLHVASILIGYGILGLISYSLIFFPVNYPILYLVFILMPYVIWRLKIIGALREISLYIKKPSKRFSLDIILSALGLYYFSVALMPEIGHDALVMHLFIPEYISWKHYWSFDYSRYIFAVSPILGDLIYLYGYIIAGETAARLINFQFIILLTSIVYFLAIWAKASKVTAKFAALIFLSTPLIFLENSTLYIDAIWSSFVVMASICLLFFVNSRYQNKMYFYVFFLMSGFAMAAKPITLLAIPGFFLIIIANLKKLKNSISWLDFCLGLSILIFVGAPSYITSFALTGNPLFPFFNDIFQSPFWYLEKFQDSRWSQGFNLDFLYQIIFNSNLFLESSYGASGFQWIFLVPFTFLLSIYSRGRSLILFLLGFIFIYFVFNSTAYLRYIMPAYVWVSSAIGASLAMFYRMPVAHIYKVVLALICCFVVFLNLTFIKSGTYYGQVSASVIISGTQKDSYLENAAPMRRMMFFVNKVNHDSSPVAIFSSSPLASGLKADYQSSSWYSFKFNDAISKIENEFGLLGLLKEEDIKFILLDDGWGTPQNRQILVKYSTEIHRIGPLSLRKLSF